MKHPAVLGFFLLGFLIATSGCRTYGAYDSEEETYRQIVRVVEQFEQELERARAELPSLESAAEEHPELAQLADQYTQLLAAHEAVLDEQRGVAEQLSPGSTYRSLHRTYGGIIAEQHTLRLQRDALIDYFAEAWSPDTARAVTETRPYALIPPYYTRIAGAQSDRSMSGLLQSIRLQPAPTGADTEISGTEAATQTDGPEQEAGVPAEGAAQGDEGSTSGETQNNGGARNGSGAGDNGGAPT